MRESAVSQHIELEASKLGVYMQRNNSGALTDSSGRVVRFGLDNISAKRNALIKSSDFIAIQPVTITPDMVGQKIGVFVALEIKASDWGHLTPGDAHGQAQAAYHRLVIAYGGRAGFVTCEDDLRRILRLI